MIEAARVLGSRVFYGDATRLDLLRRRRGRGEDPGGGGGRRRAVAGHRRPGAPALSPARAGGPRARRHALAPAAGPRRCAQRELFESSLVSGRGVLELLGASAEAARFSADRFRHHNLALFEQMHPTTRTAPS
jgi:glutathione-regulated potassium-efflux system ancillary protein KefC